MELNESLNVSRSKRNSPFTKRGDPRSAVRDDINDDVQRLKRRSITYLQRQVSNLNISTDTSASDQPTLKDKEIKEHYDICLKLHAENKINQKNAWNLKLIDCLSSLLKSRKFTSKNSILQVAGTSLDISSRVYSVRVDDVHSEGMKLASNMARIEGNQVEDSNESENPESKKKGKAKTKRGTSEAKCTIVTDVSTLLGDIKKMDYGAFQTSSNSEFSAVDNFFTSKSVMDNSGTKFALGKKLKAWIDPADEDESISSNKTYPLQLDANIKSDICNELASYEIDNFDPDNEEVTGSIDLNTSELVFDDKGIPVAELDGSVIDIFSQEQELDNRSSDEDEALEAHEVMCGDVVSICELKPIAEDVGSSNDYLYQSIHGDEKSCFTQTWAGPSHWKLKHLKPNAPRFSGRENIVKSGFKRKAKPADKPIDFHEPMELSFKTGPLQLIRRGGDASKYTLPSRCNIKGGPFSLLIKSKAVMSDMNKKQHMDAEFTAPEVQQECAPFDDDNPNSTECGTHNGMDYNEGMPTSFDDGEVACAQQQDYTEGKLIDIPDLAADTKIGYATQVKKMDMKLLKSQIWNLLTKGCETETGVHETTFSNIYRQLPEVLNASMREELSSALAFLALLHLANEHNLKLESNGQTSDFTIKKDTSH